MNKKKVVAKKDVKTKTSKKVVVKNAKPKITVKRSARVAPVEKKKYEVSLYFNKDYKFNAEGNSVVECLDQITPEYPTLKAKGILTVRSGKVSSVKVMYPFAIKRLLSGSVSKIIFEKNMLAVMR